MMSNGNGGKSLRLMQPPREYRGQQDPTDHHNDPQYDD
jgi:hypothetical protein